ncbi:hypothetical protein RLOatenuis_6710 [Rickettsiales bacterium]|nr:hypothetical protein RLOatenuis_6710 [Rickettsiales bacterium]
MALAIMPKATAIWLIDNTSLTFEQIADFCGVHKLEVQSMADDEVTPGMIGIDPIASGQLTREDIDYCEKNPKACLKLAANIKEYISSTKKRKKARRYTPVARRQDKPDAIAWLLKNCTGILDSQIIKLIGTTSSTIKVIRSNTHWNSANIQPRNPVLLSLCTQVDLDQVMLKARINKEKEEMLKKLKKDA